MRRKAQYLEAGICTSQSEMARRRLGLLQIVLGLVGLGCGQAVNTAEGKPEFRNNGAAETGQQESAETDGAALDSAAALSQLDALLQELETGSLSPSAEEERRAEVEELLTVLRPQLYAVGSDEIHGELEARYDALDEG